MDGGWVFTNSAYYSKAGLELYNIADQAKAKEWLAKSNYKGETLTFITDNSRADMDVATDIKEQLGQIGIKVDVKVSDWPTVSQVGFTPNGWHFWTSRIRHRAVRGAGDGDERVCRGNLADRRRSDDRRSLQGLHRRDGHGEAQGHLRQVAGPHVRERGGHESRQLWRHPGHRRQAEELRAATASPACGACGCRPDADRARSRGRSSGKVQCSVSQSGASRSPSRCCCSSPCFRSPSSGWCRGIPRRRSWTPPRPRPSLPRSATNSGSTSPSTCRC